MSNAAPGPDQDRPGAADRQHRQQAHRRRRHLLNHLIAYFAVMIVVIPLNRALFPEHPVVLALMVVWGAPLAMHTAWAMGLFEGLVGTKINRPPEADKTSDDRR